MSIMSTREETGDVPGLQSVAIAIGTPAPRSAERVDPDERRMNALFRSDTCEDAYIRITVTIRAVRMFRIAGKEKAS
ncbi:MAG: hypothetical protein IT518_09975 [Burkholderiales bacterium]|nr:hypothetical protein [Burkholderiales bacterium]